ncbi:MAG: ABC transporter permease [Melioribacteraceae bacterium]|nr:ABC transporter permease [Melioribacteraceae bacterium]
MMFIHFVKIALRNIFRQKAYSFINITGLALGMACSILILLWIDDELSYDKFHKNINNLYRVEEDQHYAEGVFHVTVTPFPSAPVFKEEIPEIVNAARFNWYGETAVKYVDKSFIEGNIVAADPSFFDMFTYDFVMGNNFSDNLYEIILTRDIADKYFGKENPIGETITINNEFDVKIVGVIENIPNNSTYTFDMMMPFEILREHSYWSDNWGSNSIRTFVQLAPGSSITSVNEKMNIVLKRENPDTVTEFLLFPYKDLHLYSYWGYSSGSEDALYLYIFGIVAVFVVLLACINFMNLSTARSAGRAKEIGMRKVTGALRGALVRQFFGESIITAFIGMIFALVLVLLMLEPFNNITGKKISFSIFGNIEFIGVLALITLLTGILAGSYPAIFLSGFKPVKVLKGNTLQGNNTKRFRQILVVFQFSISIILIIGTVFVYMQLSYMRTKDLGFNKEQIVYVYLKGPQREKYEIIKNNLATVPGVLNITGSGHRPAQIGSNSGGAEWEGKDPEKSVLISHTSVDYDYIETLQIKMKSGRSFSREYSDAINDSSEFGSIVINEELERLMGGGSAAGKHIKFWGADLTIVGVMNDFHFTSVETKIPPLILYVQPESSSNLIMRISPDNIPGTMDQLEKRWSEVTAGYPLNFKFLDEDFDNRYRNSERIFDLLKYFAVMAIAIACLGLFGLASYTAERKTKEIGIRKVLGAGELNLTALLCKEFFILVLISNIIAIPIAYYLIANWLENFAYRISPSWEVFILTAVIALLLALLTVGYQAIKAAVANPVESLKYE